MTLHGDRLERRIRIGPDGAVTAFSGKIEFGQGIRTAFTQLVADELDVPIERVHVILGDTGQVPFDHGTFGSHSVEQESPRLRRAAAFARRQLLERASAKLGVPVERLDTDAGHVVAGDARRLAYHELIDGRPLEGDIPPEIAFLPRERYRYLGRPMPRVEARDIVTGQATYVADIRLPEMLRGAIVRPPVRGAKVRSVDDAAARRVAGVVAVVRDGDLVGVVAARDDQARAAADAVEVDWEVGPPDPGPDVDIPLRDDPTTEPALAASAVRRSVTYVLPSIANAPIGPSAAVADVREDGTTIYGATHRPFGLREGVAKRLGLAPERVRFISQMSSGTYGRSSSFEVAVEAAVLSKHSGKPVLVQWTRAEEFAFSPSRPECVLEIAAGIDGAGRINAWRYDEHTNVHTARWFDPKNAGGTHGRNAIPPYDIPHVSVVLHMEPTPLRTANFRSLAASENVFAIESFMDELAMASRQEPLAFRLAHTSDPRLRAVLERVATASGWGRPAPSRTDRRGLGIACTVYHGTYVAQVAEVEVASSGAVRLVAMWAVVDPGAVLNPEGVRNQIEGGIQQSASWTILEELRHRDGRVAASSWDSYPIATFRDAPERILVIVAGDATKDSTGVGEPGAVPTAAAIANAVFAACGARVRDLPLSPERVRKAMAASTS
ncbi:MAG TPA: molybdopterin cofactor-binding domain-containing protein [Candidatus Limnocylindria bacterium]|nr:molybdopterin cofactor-binding domain-containing protein [Candidatus Limnocylindria bacterium]